MCIHWLSCTKFNSQQPLFEQLFDVIGNFGSLQPKNESTFPFQCYIIFETYPSFESLVPLLGEIEMCVYLLFYMKFNSQQLLFEQFFDIIVNFCSIQPWSEPTFLFQCMTIFSMITFVIITHSLITQTLLSHTATNVWNAMSKSQLSLSFGIFSNTFFALNIWFYLRIC